MALIVLGGINQDIVAHVAELPRRGETVAALQVERRAGGKGLNQAIAAARQGRSVRMLGAVGDDAAGASLRALMARETIDTGGVAVLTDHATGAAMIALAPSGDNTIIVDAGANAGYGAADLAATRPGPGDVLLTQFEATPGAIAALFAPERAGHAIRILNAAPAIAAGRDLLDLADIIVLNETELQVFALLAVVPQEEAEIVRAARSLISHPDQQVIVTLGHLGCLHVAAQSETMIAGLPMAAVDTIGAGDCFCGVLAAALDDGTGIVAALHRANAAAAISVTRRGAGEAAPTRAEVDALILESKPPPPTPSSEEEGA